MKRRADDGRISSWVIVGLISTITVDPIFSRVIYLSLQDLRTSTVAHSKKRSLRCIRSSIPNRVIVNDVTDHLRKRLYIALALFNTLIIAGEFIDAQRESTASGLISDAWHNLTDQGALFLTLYAHIRAVDRQRSDKLLDITGIGVLTAFTNAVILIGAAVWLSVIAVQRLRHPVFVSGIPVMGIALFSFAANLSIALLLQRAAKKDLNIRAAFLHMLGDAWPVLLECCLPVVW